MRGTWLFLFSCATLALSSGNPSRVTREESKCLVDSSVSFEEAVTIVQSRFAKKIPAVRDRDMVYGIKRLAPSEHIQPIEETDLIASPDLLLVTKKSKRNAVDRSREAIKPIDMNFGDYAGIEMETIEEEDDEEYTRNITCVAYYKGVSVPIDITPYLVQVLDVKLFFDNIFR